MPRCTLEDPHDCATVRAANAALRRHLDKACNERDAARGALRSVADRARGESENALGPEARALLAEIARELDALAGGE